MAEVLKKFDRYFLLDRIAQGGMAEIYRARMVSADAAGRLLVIKRIQAGFGSNSEFITMFKSEIKVTMGFNHPNIVQVHDFGDHEGQPYIAMEFVDGRNLRQFLTRFKESNQAFPIDLAAHVIEEAAAGLFYAHSFKDKISGEPLDIIHRDISPQNILIAYEGNVKVIDFGIAKAANNSESTRAGVIKGKPSYLSPEQISGETLDARCDIFALGTVLWELLTGRKLFSGENDLAVLKQIESCTSHVKAPSTLNPDVPKELDHIVLKALAKNRESRYQTCDEMRRALHKFVYSFNPEFNPSDLAYYAKDLFKREIVEDRKRIQKLYEKAENLLNSEVIMQPTRLGLASKTQMFEKPPEDTTTVFSMDNVPIPPPPPSSSSALQQPAKFPLPPSSAAKVVELDRTPKSVNRPQAGTQTFSKNRIRNEEQSQEQGGFGGSLLKALLMFGALGGAAYVWITPEYRQRLCKIPGIPCSAVDLSADAGAPVTRAPATPKGIVKEHVPAGFVALKLKIPMGAAEVRAKLDDRVIDPAASVLVKIDQPLELTILKPGFRPFKREFVITPDKVVAGQTEWVMEVPLEPISWGYLNIRTTPSAEAMLIPRDGTREPSAEGRLWTKRTPFENEKVPVGTYNIRLVNQVLGMEKTVTVQVTEGGTVTVDERLEVRD